MMRFPSPALFVLVQAFASCVASAQSVTATLTIPGVSGTITDPVTVTTIALSATPLTITATGSLAAGGVGENGFAFPGPFTIFLAGLPPATIPAGTLTAWGFSARAPLSPQGVPLFSFAWPPGDNVIDAGTLEYVDAVVPGLVGYRFDAPFSASSLKGEVITRSAHIGDSAITFALNDGRSVRVSGASNSASVSITPVVPLPAAGSVPVPTSSTTTLAVMGILLAVSGTVLLHRARARRIGR